MKKGIIILITLGLFTLSGCHNNSSPARKFKRMAEKANRSCPTRLNESITLDSTSYNEKNNTVSYFYSVTGELDSPAYMKANYATFKQALQDAVDNSVDMEEYRQFGTSIQYVYFSGSNKERLAEFSFTSPK